MTQSIAWFMVNVLSVTIIQNYEKVEGEYFYSLSNTSFMCGMPSRSVLIKT